MRWTFCDPVTGDPYPISDLEAGLQECCDLAEQLDAPQLGWLTSQNRDDWAEARQDSSTTTASTISTGIHAEKNNFHHLKNLEIVSMQLLFIL